METVDAIGAMLEGLAAAVARAHVEGQDPPPHVSTSLERLRAEQQRRQENARRPLSDLFREVAAVLEQERR